MALDPNFATNGYLYVSYTAALTTSVGPNQPYARLSRFTVVNGVASPASEKILYTGNQVQLMDGTGGNYDHAGNDLQVGPDGKLWWSVGDNVPSISNGENLANIYGKILRFNLDGSVPTDNPFVNVTGAVPYIYAYGLRNPWRFTFLPNGQAMTEDTGSSYWEDLDTIQAGGNYGWPFKEGDCGSCGYLNPAFDYGHYPTDGAASAIAAYSGSTFPQAYDHVVFFGDYVRRDIEAVSFDPNYQDRGLRQHLRPQRRDDRRPDRGSRRQPLLREHLRGHPVRRSPPPARSPRRPRPRPRPAPGARRCRSSSPRPPPPTPTASRSPSRGTSVTVRRSPRRPTPCTATRRPAPTPPPSPSPTGPRPRPPPPPRSWWARPRRSASITAPATYNAGQTVSFSGTATDPTDGTLPASAYTWTVDQYVNGVLQPTYFAEVADPFYGPSTGSTSGSVTIPTDPSQVPNSFYRITLSVTDSLGLTTVVTKDLQPNLTTWSTSTNVPGTGYSVDGSWETGPATFTGVAGVVHVLNGLPQAQTVGGVRYRFVGLVRRQRPDRHRDRRVRAGHATPPSTSRWSTRCRPPGPAPTSGAPISAGTADYSAADGSFYLDGGGADVFGANDQFHYVYQTLAGDGTITARVRYQSNSSAWAKAGVMIKQSPTAGSTFVDALVAPDVSPTTPNVNGIGCDANGCLAPLPSVNPAMGYGARMQYSGSKSKTPASYPAGFTSPDKWIRLSRTGNLFMSWISSDGVNWTLIGSTTVSMTGPVTIGLFDTSHNIGEDSTVAFDHVQVTAPAPPGPLPSPWTDTDVGSPAVAGSASYANGVFTVNGGGRRHLGDQRPVPLRGPAGRGQRLDRGPGHLGQQHQLQRQGRGDGQAVHHGGEPLLPHRRLTVGPRSRSSTASTARRPRSPSPSPTDG